MKTPPLRIVCFGDSITGSRPREDYRHAYLKYSDLLQLMLEARLGMGTTQVLNRGFAGGTSSQARARLREDVLDESPHIAIVLIGGNDRSNADISTAQTCDNLHAIFSQTRNAGINVLALQYHFLPGDQCGTAWHWLPENNHLIAEVAQSLHIPLLDMMPVFHQAVRHTPRRELVNLEDGVHLHPGGEMLYARAVFSRLLELNWINLPTS